MSAPTPPNNPSRTQTVHREQVYQAIVTLHESGRVATRDRLSDVIEITPEKLDEHLRMLKDARRIRPIERGVFVPIYEFPPPRAMSLTVLPNGYAKVDLGDVASIDAAVAQLPERIDALATQRGVTRSDIMGEAAELLLSRQGRRQAVRP